MILAACVSMDGLHGTLGHCPAVLPWSPERARRPAARDPAAEHGAPGHQPLERAAAGKVPSAHARELAGREEPLDRTSLTVQDTALKVGRDAAQCLAGKREELDRPP